MSETNAMLDAIAAKPVDGTTIMYGYAHEPDTIAGSPCWILMEHRGVINAGASPEQLTFTIPAIIIADNSDAAGAAVILNDALDTIRAAFRSGTTLGGTVLQVRIKDWDSNRAYTMGEAGYLGIELTLEVIMMTPTAAYSP